MEESSNEGASRSPSNNEGPLTPPRTPYESLRLDMNHIKVRKSPYLPNSTSDCTVSSTENPTNFDMSDFNCSDDMIPHGGLESSELDQYLPGGETSYVGPVWFNRNEQPYVNNSEKETIVSTTQDFPEEEKSSHWQQEEEKKKKNSELTKLTTLAPSVQPNNFPFILSRSDAISPAEEEYAASHFYPPTTYASYSAGCLTSACPYWPSSQQQPIPYNFMNYTSDNNCWSN